MNDSTIRYERSHAWIGVLATLLAFAVVAKISSFAPDSWSYLELSNTVFGDFYRANTVRNYAVISDYSSAFPPVWPVVIAGVRKISDIGIYAGTLVNFFVCLALLAALVRLARQLDLPAWIGTAVYLGILACTAFLQDALAARNCALSLLLLTLTVQILVRPEIRIGDAMLAGLWMGLMSMNRFDALPAAAVCGLIVIVRSWRMGTGTALAAGAAYAAVLALMLAPWIVFSKLRFDMWWISDNTRQIFLARDANVMNYYATPPESDLLARPLEWLKGLLTNKIVMSWKGLVFTLIHSVTLPLLGVLVIIRAGTPNPPIATPMRRFLVCGGLLAASFVVAPTLVGYGDERYFLPVQWFVLMALFAKLHRLTPGFWTRGRVIALLAIMTIAAAPSESMPWLVTNRAKLATSDWFPANRHPTAGMNEVTQAIERDSRGQSSRLLIYTHHPEGWDEWEYGALTGRPVAVMPRVQSGTFASYLRDYRITHIYDGEHLGGLVDTSRVNLIPLDVPGLFRVEIRPQES